MRELVKRAEALSYPYSRCAEEGYTSEGIEQCPRTVVRIPSFSG